MICDFLDSNFFQTCILILTAGITWWIYRSRKKKELQNAVTILLLQIEDIEKNIEFLGSEGLVGGVIQEKAVHYSAVIYDENNWTKYSHLIVGRISQLAFENIDKFFKVELIVTVRSAVTIRVFDFFIVVTELDKQKISLVNIAINCSKTGLVNKAFGTSSVYRIVLNNVFLL